MTAARWSLPLLAVAMVPTASIGQDSVNDAGEKAVRAALARVAPSVVKIVTAGGTESVITPPSAGRPAPKGPGIRRGSGPTTGVIVDADGFVVTSSFNFANKPADIFVTVPGRTRQYVATVVAADQTRMLTLLKLDLQGDPDGLPVPEPVPAADVQVGRWAVAVGRTLDPDVTHVPSASIGIVSAVGRIWGKMIQTDAKVSPVNYGGPLVAVDGRVYGVLVPASTRGEGETAGFEWYDSGIGFAVPLADIFAVLPKLKAGTTLRKGLLGITPKGSDVYGSVPVVDTVSPDSAADRAGVKPGDQIVKFDGKPVPHFSAFQHLIGPKYEGDTVSLVVRRGDADVALPQLTLTGTQTAYVRPYLGVLPFRDDAEAGVQVRYVYPDSPAAKAGVAAGDRIVKFGRAGGSVPKIKDRAALLDAVGKLLPGVEVSIELKRKGDGKSEAVTAKLAATPDDLPAELPLPSSAGKAPEGDLKKKDKDDPFGIPPQAARPAAGLQFVSLQEPKPADGPKVETGFLRRTIEALGREYWVYVPDNYTPGVAHGLIVWFHQAGQGGRDGERLARVFEKFAADHHFVLMGPKATGADGWVPSETEAVMQDVKAVLGAYTIDRARVVSHGMGVGGQMAVYVGFAARDTFRGKSQNVSCADAACGMP